MQANEMQHGNAEEMVSLCCTMRHIRDELDYFRVYDVYTPTDEACDLVTYAEIRKKEADVLMARMQELFNLLSGVAPCKLTADMCIEYYVCRDLFSLLEDTVLLVRG
jgi:hypothetical protein